MACASSPFPINQREAAGSFHFKGTLVHQAERSRYSVTEASVGGAIARHDLTIMQVQQVCGRCRHDNAA